MYICLDLVCCLIGNKLCCIVLVLHVLICDIALSDKLVPHLTGSSSLNVESRALAIALISPVVLFTPDQGMAINQFDLG